MKLFNTLPVLVSLITLLSRLSILLIQEYYHYFQPETIPEREEGYTWVGTLTLGDNSYSYFREIELWRRHTTSLYFAIVTMATVDYGDIHAVNMREMIYIMIYVSFDIILGAYLIGNNTA